MAKYKKGVTLLELIIAMGVLIVVAVPILVLMFQSVRLNADAHRLTMATFAAQQRIEEFVGLNLEEISHELGVMPVESGGFYIWASIDNVQEGGVNFPALRRITVRVYADQAQSIFLVQQQNVLNVVEGGFL